MSHSPPHIPISSDPGGITALADVSCVRRQASRLTALDVRKHRADVVVVRLLVVRVLLLDVDGAHAAAAASVRPRQAQQTLEARRVGIVGADHGLARRPAAVHNVLDVVVVAQRVGDVRWEVDSDVS
jgi:hypothetical protein